MPLYSLAVVPDAFYLSGSGAFERWMEEERGRLMVATTSALLSLATDATRANEHEAAVEWWRNLTTLDPLNGRFAVGFLKALAARGDRAEALAFARQHELVIRRELESRPDPTSVESRQNCRMPSHRDLVTTAPATGRAPQDKDRSSLPLACGAGGSPSLPNKSLSAPLCVSVGSSPALAQPPAICCWFVPPRDLCAPSSGGWLLR